MDTSILVLVAHTVFAQTPDGMAPDVYASGLIQPPAFNWCGPTSDTFDRCTPVKFQGGCGSCWAFATTAVVENLIYLDNPSTVPDLSEQYLISCNPQLVNIISGGCSGGLASFDAFVDTYRAPPENAAGAVYEVDFPNVYKDVSCGNKPHTKHEKLRGWVDLPDGSDVRTIQEHISAYGPIFAEMCAGKSFSGYAKGSIIRDDGAPCIIANHAIVIVGWDDNGGDGYWIVRNSYGQEWGNQGYAKVAYGANGIAYHAVAAVYKPHGVLPPTFGCSSTGDAGLGFYLVLGLIVAYVMLSSSKRR